MVHYLFYGRLFPSCLHDAIYTLTRNQWHYLSDILDIFGQHPLNNVGVGRRATPQVYFPPTLKLLHRHCLQHWKEITELALFWHLSTVLWMWIQVGSKLVCINRGKWRGQVSISCSRSRQVIDSFEKPQPETICYLPVNQDCQRGEDPILSNRKHSRPPDPTFERKPGVGATISSQLSEISGNNSLPM